MKSLLIFFLLCYSAKSQDYIDLDTLWVSNVAGNPIGFSHDDSQILMQYEDIDNNSWVVNHIDANTGEFLFFTRGMYAGINPILNVYYTYINDMIGVYDMYNGELIDSILLPNNLPESYSASGAKIAVSNDGKKLAITGFIRYEENHKTIDESLILIIDLELKKAITAINFYNGVGRDGNLPFWSKDNQHIYAVPQERDEEHKLTKINIYTGKVVKTFVYNNEDNSNRIMGAWVSDKGNYFFVSSGTGLFAYNSDNDEELFRLKHCRLNLDCNSIYNLNSNENKNLIISIGLAKDDSSIWDEDTRIWNLSNGINISTLWYNSRKGKDTDAWRFQISNKSNTKTLFRGYNGLFCISNFWENPIINSVTNQETDIRFSEEGNIINIQTQTGDNQITISNLTGAVIQTIPINQPMQLININKHEFTSGAYFITVQNSAGVYNYQFIGGM